MFKIELIDIGSDGLIAEAILSVDTLIEAEYIAGAKIGGVLGTDNVQLIHDEQLIYRVIADGVDAGLVNITSLGEGVLK